MVLHGRPKVAGVQENPEMLGREARLHRQIKGFRKDNDVEHLGFPNPGQPPLFRFRQFPGKRDLHLEQKRPASDLEIAEI